MPHSGRRRGKRSRAPCAGVLPYFSRGVAFEAYETLVGIGHDVEDEPLDLVFCNRHDMEEWINETVSKHYHRWCALKEGMRAEGRYGSLPQSFSVAVETDLSGDPLVSIVLDVQATTKPLSRVMAALRFIAKHSAAIERSENLKERFGDCWLCLDNLYESTGREGSLVCSDVFCCGHPVCVACSAKVGKLERCGVCRRRCPNDSGLRERIMKTAVQEKMADEEEERSRADDTLNEVLAVMEMLDL